MIRTNTLNVLRVTRERKVRIIANTNVTRSEEHRVAVMFTFNISLCTHIFHVNENLERFPHVGNILSIKACFWDLETFVTGEL